MAATSPPYPTPGWVTTQVYPARGPLIAAPRVESLLANAIAGCHSVRFLATVHESMVTSVQKRMEPRRSLLGASVDVTEVRNAPTGKPSLLVLHKLAELYELPYALLLEREGPGGVTFRSRIATR